MEEVWKRYKGTNAFISNLGRCKSVCYRCVKFHKYFHHKDGHKDYFRITDTNGKTKIIPAAETIAKLFVDNPQNACFVFHKDGNTHNHRADNLSWTTVVRYCNNIEGELWKDIDGFEDKYEISSFGRVYSKTRYRNGKLYKGKLLRPLLNSSGYYMVSLSKDNFKPKFVLVHRLVAVAFLPNKENKPHIDHINTNKIDNSVTNLRWATAKENHNNPITVELKRAVAKKDNPIHNTRVVSIDILTHERKVYNSFIEAAKDNGITYIKGIKNCCYGLQKTHMNKTWSLL